MTAGALEGRRAVVTGGSRGLGLAIAKALEGAGAAITVIDLEPALAGLPAGWEGFAADLGAPDAMDRLRPLAARLGAVDVVVANAGVVPPWRGMAELDGAEWARVMAINSWGVAATVGAFAEALAASGRGSAILMASLNGFKAHPKQVLYTASKHAVVGILRAAALDLGPRGVRVNALAPGPIATEALMGRLAARHAQGMPAPDAALAEMAGVTALKRIATEADVAAAALWLASDASAAVTGLAVPVDGGML